MPVAVVLLWDHPFDVVAGIAESIGGALTELGFDVRYLNVMDVRVAVKWPELLDQLADPEIAGCEFAVSVGALPLSIQVDDRWLFDILGKQFFLFSLDALFYDVFRVTGVPEFLQAARDSPRLGVLSPDRHACGVINSLAPHEICTYVPYGGLQRPVAAADRLERIAVIGNLGHELARAPADATYERLALQAPPTLGVSTDDLVAFARELQRPESTPTITTLAVEFLGLSADTVYTPAVTRYLAQIDAFSKWRRRIDAVTALHDVPVDFFGSGWRPHTAGLRDCRHLGSVSYWEVPEVCQRYKVVLNFDPNWGYGLHDRVFTALANGARVLTNASPAITDLHLPDPDAVLVYDANRPDMSDVAGLALSLPTLDPGALLGFRSATSWLARMDAFLAGPRGRTITTSALR